jgi:hypothetical protein
VFVPYQRQPAPRALLADVSGRWHSAAPARYNVLPEMRWHHLSIHYGPSLGSFGAPCRKTSAAARLAGKRYNPRRKGMHKKTFERILNGGDNSGLPMLSSSAFPSGRPSSFL